MTVRERKAERQRLVDLGWEEVDDPTDEMHAWRCAKCREWRAFSDCPACGRCERCSKQRAEGCFPEGARG